MGSRRDQLYKRLSESEVHALNYIDNVIEERYEGAPYGAYQAARHAWAMLAGTSWAPNAREEEKSRPLPPEEEENEED